MVMKGVISPNRESVCIGICSSKPSTIVPVVKIHSPDPLNFTSAKIGYQRNACQRATTAAAKNQAKREPTDADTCLDGRKRASTLSTGQIQANSLHSAAVP